MARRLRTTFQTTLFWATVSAAVLALVVAGALFAVTMRGQIDRRIEDTLMAEARVVADLLSRGAPTATAAALDEEADRIGQLIGARVTLIAPDGRVVGDSAETLDAVRTMENHGQRPEVAAARATGIGHERRFSATLNIDMLYVAAPVQHPAIGFVRLAVPLTAVRQQLRHVLTATLTALAFALAGGTALAWWFSARIGRRVRLIAGVAQRYRAGDLTPPRLGFGEDELGTVARALDQSVQEIGRQLDQQARDRARTEAILAGMIEGVVVIDRQGHLQLFNAAAQRMLKLDDVALGHPYVETLRFPAIAQLADAALRGDRPPPVELPPAADSSRTIMATATPAAVAAQHGVILVLHDITELKRADQIRRDFVANVSHELRTPLTAIRGYVEAIADEDSTEDARRFIDVIRRHALRMERLVTDLLRLARLDAGQELLQVEPCDVRAVAADVIDTLTPAAEARGQRVDLTVAPGSETIAADSAKLHDVLRNLIANAIAYAPHQSTITVDARLSGEDIAIVVSDEGPGIPEPDLSRIFERFYRVDRSRGRDPGGTGLGLAIVKHLVELHGGTTRVENRAEGGARFTITVPRCR